MSSEPQTETLDPITLLIGRGNSAMLKWMQRHLGQPRRPRNSAEGGSSGDESEFEFASSGSDSSESDSGESDSDD